MNPAWQDEMQRVVDDIAENYMNDDEGGDEEVVAIGVNPFERGVYMELATNNRELADKLVAEYGACVQVRFGPSSGTFAKQHEPGRPYRATVHVFGNPYLASRPNCRTQTLWLYVKIA